jgi:uncharacterized membrane protein YbhN (UPF0104 family)
MKIGSRAIGVATSFGFGLFLIALLFWWLPISPGVALVAAFAAPIWLYAVVIALTLSNLVVGALKWRVAADYLSRPASRPSLYRMTELTTLGEFFGQILPVQLSTLLVRWAMADKELRASGYVARATFFEQTFDVILVLAGSLAAVAVIGFGLAPVPALIIFSCFVAFSFVALRTCLWAGAGFFQSLESRGIWPEVSAAAREGFVHAAEAPARILATLSLYSLLRLILVALRAVAVLAVFAPQTQSWLVFVASPPVALLTTVPIAPAGLGVAEWTWSALLVHGGTAASVAVTAALAVRLTNIVALVVIVATMMLVRRLGTPARQSSGV